MPATKARRLTCFGYAAVPLLRRRTRRSARRGAVLALAAIVWLLLAPGVGATSGNSKAVKDGGTVTFAEEPGAPPVYVFPLYPLADYSNNNTAQLQNLLYQPLYWFGKGNTLDISQALSMASAPVFSDDDTTVTIHLKTGMEWSTGAPITSRDVEFWINMLESNKSNYGPWVPGTWPTELKSADYPNAHTVVLHLNASTNPEWFTGTALAEITPMPQQAWDKTSMSGAIGTYDTTKNGAVTVYKFLNAQSNTTATYSSSPLWKVVDGPFRILSNTSSGEFTFVPNDKYFGPKPRIAKLVEVPYTSYAAENDALLTGGVDYGFISNTSVPEISRLKHDGYQIDAWPIWGINFLYVNYTNPATAPFMKQQYVRVAMQELINQPQLIKTIYQGYAWPTYGPVPTKQFT
ncbi:MAG: ABC transporter substrate-binding protein, partial [Nitrososphaerales archaeon]